MTNNNHATGNEVKSFYNNYKIQQQSIGVNIRHRTIFKNLRKEGLLPTHKVLEIGCGIGTVSGLIINYLSQGFFVGVDISNESIEFAKKRFSTKNNAEFLVNDMSAFSHKFKFDYIVLPDVLEHIPVELHAGIFKLLESVSHNDTQILINIPEPHCLNWIRQNHPQKLQIIDQSLDTAKLIGDANNAGFKLYSMNSYGLQYQENEYTSFVFKRNLQKSNYHLKPKYKLASENLLSKL
ncbi:MAG: class I SAM-dependent methyltransferase [Bacteroidetes bacterium]|nr:class I SAM-dependent methyltransferase [Bacteroidota bacterium]